MTETSYINLVRFIIIDKIHLLHDEQGPDLESIVPFTSWVILTRMLVLEFAVVNEVSESEEIPVLQILFFAFLD